MEEERVVRVRQVVDWSAALWAGLISGLIYLLVASVLSGIFLGNLMLPVLMIAGILMGSQAVLAPPTFITIITALVIHIPLAIVFTGIVSFVIHRWGLIVGVVGGALLGLALYYINFYTLTDFFPWFSGLRGGVMIFSHLVFGAAAGGFYELLEVEEFVPIEMNSEFEGNTA